MRERGTSRMDWLRLVSAVAWLVIFVIWPQLTFAVTLLIIGGCLIAYNARVFWLTVVRQDYALRGTDLWGRHCRSGCRDLAGNGELAMGLDTSSDRLGGVSDFLSQLVRNPCQVVITSPIVNTY